MKVTIERRSKVECDNRYFARKARRAERKVRRLFWGSYMPEYGLVMYGGGAYIWTGRTDWSDEDEPVLSDVEAAARDLVSALRRRVEELEDPCP